MKSILITGSAGLVGSESALHFASKGHTIIGIDNDMRAKFFGPDASTRWSLRNLQKELGGRYSHFNVDIRDKKKLGEIFKSRYRNIKAIIHTAAQPSHDWAARDPETDFSVNAVSTLNLLELARRYCPETPFVFMSTNKVYGDLPNRLPLIEKKTRWELARGHKYCDGIDETMSIDQSKHSLFGASKIAADVLVQEYGRYFNMPTVCFRGGCLTGPNHSGTILHGFLSYLMKCAVTEKEYFIFGYKGKQVRDNIHSHDLVRMFDEFIKRPRRAEVYNTGGSRFSNCSMIEAIALCEEIAGNKVKTKYCTKNREGDHIWYISNVNKFKMDYPKWNYEHGIEAILAEIYTKNRDRWIKEKS
ncbi:MAG: NAD-dependent epimerase/dehydratase family protein [Candidatus Omnitrophota bacterium]